MKRSWKVKQGNKINLTREEESTAKEIRERMAVVLAKLRSDALDPSEIDSMGDLATTLHSLLKKRGKEPKHHKFMLENRGVPVTHPEFYRHIHAVEDLLGFLENENANDNPEDMTLDSEFKLKVYSRRWGHDDTYTIARTKSGWTVRHVSDAVAVGRDGRVGRKSDSGLYEILNGDSINYPEALPGYLEWLWTQAAERGLEHDEVQAAFDALGDWIATCERSSPVGVFAHFK